MTRFLVAASVLVAVVGLQAAPTQDAAQVTVIRVTVNGEEIDFGGLSPIMSKRRVMVPLRGVFEKMGAYVEWRTEEQMVIATRGAKKIECWVGKELAAIDDEQLKMDAPPMLVSGRTYVPIRFISEALGARVLWDKTASLVAISVPPGSVEPR